MGKTVAALTANQNTSKFTGRHIQHVTLSMADDIAERIIIEVKKTSLLFAKTKCSLSRQTSGMQSGSPSESVLSVFVIINWDINFSVPTHMERAGRAWRHRLQNVIVHQCGC